MSEPRKRKKVSIRLTPNGANDDPAIVRKIQADLQRLAKKAGVPVEAPGTVDPDAVEDPRRVEKIKEKAAPALAKLAVEYSRTKAAKTTRHKDGKVTSVVEDVRRTSLSFSANLEGLAKLGAWLSTKVGQIWAAVRVVGTALGGKTKLYMHDIGGQAVPIDLQPRDRPQPQVEMLGGSGDELHPATGEVFGDPPDPASGA